MDLQPNRPRRESSAVYERIACDIAHRIAKDELAQGVKLSGRTLMSSEYGVSPETIRRSFALLEEMGVVEVVHNSGVKVVSKEKAQLFIEKFEQQDESKLLFRRMRALLEEHEALDKELISITKQLFSLQNRFNAMNPFPIFEYTIPSVSNKLGQSLGALHFWQETGATVIAIRRDGAIMLSPGPYCELQAEDILMMVGPEEALMRIIALFD